MKYFLLLCIQMLFVFTVIAQSYTLTVPTGAINIQWYKATTINTSFAVIPGETSASFTTDETGAYYAQFELDGCNNSSNYFIIVNEASTYEYTITLEDTQPTDIIQWYNGTEPIVGATASSLSVTEGGDYWAKVQREDCPFSMPAVSYRNILTKLEAVDDMFEISTTEQNYGVFTGNVVADDNNMNGGIPDTIPKSSVPYTIELIQEPQYGDVMLITDANGEHTGEFTYTANTSFTGIDSFRYRICIGNVCDTAVVSLKITCADRLREQYVKVPNMLSPNNDGVNDEWKINELAIFKDCYDFNEVIIFNRWEVEVFRKRNYGLDGIWWDGRKISNIDDNKEERLPASTYYYIILIDGDRKDALTGFIHLQY